MFPLIEHYIQDKRGQFAMMFAIMAVPLLIATGMAVDIGRLNSLEQRLQDAADAAALRAVTASADDDAELQALAKSIFLANLNVAEAELVEFNAVANSDGSVSIDAVAKIPAAFAQINGFPSMLAKVDSGADADSGEDLEMVIAFDTTNSMGFDNTWTKALDTLEAVLDQVEVYAGDNNFFVSLVPFSDRVNVGTSRTSWLDGSTPTGWNGCVEPREETGTLYDGTAWDWILGEDKPVGQNKLEASIPGTTGGLAARGGGYPHCPSVAIVPPTNDVDALITAANNFTKSGTGRFDEGMAWAWRLLSTDWRGQWSSGGFAAANAKERRQIAIMVTDGRTEAYTWEVDKTRDWAYNEGSVGGFKNMVHVCQQMKNAGMEIFMIRIDGNDHATDYMKECATTPDYYLEVTDNADLELAFKDVLKVVKENVRLTH